MAHAAHQAIVADLVPDDSAPQCFAADEKEQWLANSREAAAIHVAHWYQVFTLFDEHGTGTISLGDLGSTMTMLEITASDDAFLKNDLVEGQNPWWAPVTFERFCKWMWGLRQPEVMAD